MYKRRLLRDSACDSFFYEGVLFYTHEMFLPDTCGWSNLGIPNISLTEWQYIGYGTAGCLNDAGPGTAGDNGGGFDPGGIIYGGYIPGGPLLYGL